MRKKRERSLIHRIFDACYGVFLGLMVLAPLFPSSQDWDQKASPVDGIWVTDLPDHVICSFGGECTKLDA